MSFQGVNSIKDIPTIGTMQGNQFGLFVARVAAIGTRFGLTEVRNVQLYSTVDTLEAGLVYGVFFGHVDYFVDVDRFLANFANL